MNTNAAVLALAALTLPALAGPDFNPPAWRGQTGSTVQGWDFIFGLTYPGDTTDNAVVPLRNPNELPPRIIPFSENEPVTPHVISNYRTVVSQPNLTDDFVTLQPRVPNDELSRLVFAIPNAEADTPLWMHIQLTYRCIIPPELIIIFATNLQSQNDILTESYQHTDVVDRDRGNWNQATWDIQFSRTAGWDALIFTNNSGFNLDIESLVVDTIPAPGPVAALAAFGLVTARRRRR